MSADPRLRRLLALFLATAALLNFPALVVADRLATVLGPAFVPVYIFAVWVLAIVTAAWLLERRQGG